MLKSLRLQDESSRISDFNGSKAFGFERRRFADAVQVFKVELKAKIKALIRA